MVNPEPGVLVSQPTVQRGDIRSRASEVRHEVASTGDSRRSARRAGARRGHRRRPASLAAAAPRRHAARRPTTVAPRSCAASFEKLCQALKPETEIDLVVISGATTAETLHGHIIVANESLADLPEGERIFILAHEMGHVVSDHWHQMGGLYRRWIPGEVTPSQTDPVAGSLGRDASGLAHRQEFEADAFALQALRRFGIPPEVAVSAFMRQGMQHDTATHPGTRKAPGRAARGNGRGRLLALTRPRPPRSPCPRGARQHPRLRSAKDRDATSQARFVVLRRVSSAGQRHGAGRRAVGRTGEGPGSAPQPPPRRLTCRARICPTSISAASTFAMPGCRVRACLPASWSIATSAAAICVLPTSTGPG